jgi:hypothetical protein
LLLNPSEVFELVNTAAISIAQFFKIIGRLPDQPASLISRSICFSVFTVFFVHFFKA